MSVDLAALFFLNLFAGQSPLLDGVIVFFAAYLPYILVLVFFIFALRQASLQKDRLLLLAEGLGAGVIARGVVELIRVFVERPRPFIDNPAIAALLNEASFSFPSGHAAFFFALATVVFLYNRRAGWWFFAASAFIGIARIAAGVHYPTDIAGGAALGILAGFLAHIICARGQKK